MSKFKGVPVGAWWKKSKLGKDARWRITVEANGLFLVSFVADFYVAEIEHRERFPTFAEAVAYAEAREPGKKNSKPKVTELF